MNLDNSTAAGEIVASPSNAASENMEKHSFEFSSAFLVHTVNSQSSTLAKAVLEGVMNSVDADASKIVIDLTNTSMVISDDGHGFRTREEVLACFKVFGFDHSEHAREFGRFGLGRAQLWAFASTVWRTSEFIFDVDVRERGFDWYLGTSESKVDGLRIEAKFYKELTNVEMVEFRSELEKLVRYSEVPIILNGEQLSKPPSESKWTVTTDEAYLRTSEGYYLAVYNQGIFVANLNTSSVGISGTLVTRRGHALTLNVSRNEIMRATCPVWAKLKPKIAELASKTKAKRLTDADRDFLATQTADPMNIDNFDRPIITMANGKHLSLHDAIKHLYNTPLTVAETGNRMAESLIRDKTAVVVAQVTLARFGVENVAGLVQVWRDRFEAAKHRMNYRDPRLKGADRESTASKEVRHCFWLLTSSARSITIFENIKDCPGYRQLQAAKINQSDLTPRQRAFLNCMEQMRPLVCRAINKVTNSKQSTRSYILGRGEGIEAYTDGSTYIAIVDVEAEQMMKEGLSGFLRLAHLMVHEYLHDCDDSGSHAHDLEFMETFHDVVLDSSEDLFRAATSGFNAFVKEEGKMSRKSAKQLDLVQKSESVAAPTAAQ